MQVLIRDLEPGDYRAWRLLWDGYCRFYGVALDESVSVNTWNRLLDPGDITLFARIAVRDDQPCGFAHCVVHPATWVSEPCCYLEDLYVSADARGNGIGRALMTDLLATCKARRYARIYWHTHHDNHVARALYDSFQPADDFVRYRIVL